MKIKYILLISILTFGFWSCQSDQNQNQAQVQVEDYDSIIISKKQFEINNLALEQPKKMMFSEEIVVNGMIDVPPENRATVNSFFDGYVSQTKLLIGDEVKKGQLLIKLKNPDFVNIQQDYVDALADLEYQTAEFNRKSILVDDNVIAQKVFQKTKNEYLSAKARVSATRAQIALMNLNPTSVEQGNFTSEIAIYAPISGKISKLDISLGKFVSQSDRIMEIVNTDHVHLELNIYEKDLPKITVNQEFEFSLPEASADRHPAFVKLIGAEIDAESRFVKVHAHPLDKNKNYVVGMYVNAYFDINSKAYYALPESAFTEIDGKTFVLQLNQKTETEYMFKKQVVSTDIPQNGFNPLKSIEADTTGKYLANGVFNILADE